jgi:hypothetical protein
MAQNKKLHGERLFSERALIIRKFFESLKPVVPLEHL